jgi:hypothetical protein
MNTTDDINAAFLRAAKLIEMHALAERWVATGSPDDGITAAQIADLLLSEAADAKAQAAAMVAENHKERRRARKRGGPVLVDAA